MSLKNRNILITGASQGLGFEIAKQFVTQGANIMICARNEEKLSDAHRALSKIAHNHTKVLATPTDVSNFEQMNTLAAATIEQLGTVHALIANAGVYGTMGPLDEINWQEWSHAIDVNLKGTVLQARALLPHFKQNRYGKIIILSGGGATKPMPNLSAYAASKAGVVRFAETLAEEVKDFNIDVNALAPGALNTRLLDELLAAGPDKVGKILYEQSLRQKQTGGTPLERGAALCAFLASAESDGITGKLISAIWDPWEKFSDYLADLKNSDIYTLRRIVPEDRGKKWSESV